MQNLRAAGAILRAAKPLPYCLLILLASINTRAQTSLYVDSSMAASGAGSSWSTAYKTLSAALLAVYAGSASTRYIINIAKGSYYPTGIQGGSNQDSVFFIGRAGVKLYGGFPSGGGARAPAIYKTVLSGNIGAPASRADNSNHLMVVGNISNPADSVVLDGLTFTESVCTGTIPYHGVALRQYAGGALAIQDVACRMLVNACTFLRDSAERYHDHGGAVYNDASATTFSNCTFTDNATTGDGGAVYIKADLNTAPVIVTGCSFARNSAANSGGAICSSREFPAGGSGAIIMGCSFGGSTAADGNTAGNAGGAISDLTESGTGTAIRNCTFSNNHAAGGGGGVYSVTNNSPAGNPAILRGCSFIGNSSDIGGGAFVAVSNCFTAIDSCSFVGNKASNTGGGLYCVYGARGGVPLNSGRNTITRCRFMYDSAAIGGGGCAVGLSELSHCRFVLNKAAIGGGLCQQGAGNYVSLLTTDTFSGNAALSCGGGFCNSENFTGDSIVNCLFSGNRAGQRGGAIYDSLASSLLASCTLAGDTAATGNALYNTINSGSTFRNCIIWEGTDGVANHPGNGPILVTYSTIQGGYTGAGNLSADPLFVAAVPASGAPTAAGNYDIIRCSPAIDAGRGSGTNASPADLAGRARIYGAEIDQGAYEYSGAPYPALISGGGPLCAGNSIQLTSLNPGGAWTGSNPATARVSAGGVVSAIATGLDTISYTATQGSCTGTAFTVISVVAKPSVNVTQSGAALMAEESGALYQWIDCANGRAPIAGAQSQGFTAGANGRYAVIVTRNGCADTSACYTVGGLLVAPQRDGPGIRVYPNPAAMLLNVVVEDGAPARIIRLRDAAGSVVHEIKPAAAHTAIRTDGFAAGIYFLEVYAGERWYRAMIVVPQ